MDGENFEDVTGRECDNFRRYRLSWFLGVSRGDEHATGERNGEGEREGEVHVDMEGVGRESSQ